MGMSAHAVAGSLAWIHMRHARRTHLAHWSLEEVLIMLKQFVSRAQPIILGICEN